MKCWYVFLICISFLSGCSSFKYYASPYPITSPTALQWKSIDSISMKNEADSGFILLRSHDISYWGDLRQITDVAIMVLSEEFHHRGIILTTNSPNILRLKMIYAGLAYSLARYQCAMHLQVEVGNSYKGVYYGYNVGFSLEKACDGVITKTVKSLLEDPKIMQVLLNEQ